MTAYLSVSASHPRLRRAVEAALATPAPTALRPIGLVGCGWIGGLQLSAYRAEGFDVVALVDRNPEKAERHRAEYFPDAQVYRSVEELLQHPTLEVVDVATHLEGRPDTIRRCLEAGKSVLSQKPFVEDLAVGAELADAAIAHGVTLAVNQNGRWAPHFGAMLAMVRAGLIGQVVSADFHVAWPHDEVISDMPAFASMADLILFDFGAHWFDIVHVLAPDTPLTVYAAAGTRPGQSIAAPLQASALVTGEGFISSLDFRAGERFAEAGSFRVAGTQGVIAHTGLSLGGDAVELHTADGLATVNTSDDWFAYGLVGAMRGLLVALADGDRPPHSAESAMGGLAISFAALESARTGWPVAVGTVQQRHPSSVD